MAREFAKVFYRSQEWKRCRESYIRKMPRAKRGLCEECYKHGKHVLGKELHHKIWLNEKNINNKEITLNHDNLILLCFECHQKIHGKRKEYTTYGYDENGNVVKI
mgnify:CR=1 FL=1